MTGDFFRQVAVTWPNYTQAMRGYDIEEMDKIERLYGIVIAGELREFLMQAGRCDGGLIGDDPIVLYRPTWTARTHILFQMKIFNDLQEIGAWQYMSKPFVFAVESETQYFYLRTGELNDKFVYWYDENNETVKNTQKTLFEYLTDVLDRYPRGETVCCGDLLKI